MIYAGENHNGLPRRRRADRGLDGRVDHAGLIVRGNGRGRGVFDGRILVEKQAQHSDAILTNDNLVLSRDAEVDTKPQLEIHADDVKCSHGTTVGQLDPAQLFYLRSRGIDAAEARRLLCLGFAGEILDRCAIAPLGEHVRTAVADRLAQARIGAQGV